MSGRGGRLVGAALLAAAGAMVAAPASAALTDTPTPTWGTNGRITAELAVGNTVYVGGTFTGVVDRSGTTYTAANLAAFNATTGAAITSWAPTTDGAVNALATDGTRIFVGGSFKTVDGKARANLAAVDPSTGALSSWHAGTSSTVDSVAATGGSIFVSGNFSKVTDSSGTTFTRAYVAKLSGSNATLVTSWAPAPTARVRALAVSADGTRIFLGGDFTSVGRTGTNKTAAVLASTGALDAYSSVANNGTSFATVYALFTDATRLYEAVGGSGGACTVVNATSGALVWSKHTNGNVHGVRTLGGTAYCGGHFSGTASFAGLTRNKLAAVDIATGTVLPFAPVINSSLGVWTLESDSTHLFAGGDFTKISGLAEQHYAEWVDTGLLSVPSAPTQLGATSGAGVVHLTWQPPTSDGGAPVQQYNVYRHDPSGAYGTPLTSTSGTSFDDTTGTVGTTYTYEVTAVNTVGEGPPSNEVTGSPAAGAPGAPTGLTAVDSSGAVQLTWSAPATDGGSAVTDYKVYRSTSSGSEAFLVDTGSAATTSYLDTAVTARTTYFYYVTAVNVIGEGPPTAEVTVTPGLTVPGAPTLSGTAGDSVAHLWWTAPADDGGSPITKYAVLRDTSRIATVDATTLTYDDTTAVDGTTYVYKVRAINAIGTGAASNKVTLTPVAATPSPTPSPTAT